MSGLYQRKPVTVEACQWRGDNADEMTAFLGSDFNVLDEQDRANSDDPEATAQYRMPAEVFDEEWEPIQP